MQGLQGIEAEAAQVVYRAIVEGLEDAVAVVVPDADDLCCVYANARLGTLLGRETAALIGQEIRAVMPPTWADAVVAAHRAALRTHTPATETLVLPDGDAPAVYRLRVIPVFTQGDRPTYLVSLVQEWNGDNGAAHASGESYRIALDALSEGVLFSDMGGVIRASNPAAERILGLMQGEIVGLANDDPRWRVTRGDGSAFLPDEYPAVVTQRTGLPRTGELMGVHKADGEVVWISTDAHPVRTADGAVAGVVASFTDVTAEREATEALRRAKEQAEAANRAKDAFLATMSHELRTPLNAVLGFAELLSEPFYGPLTPAQAEFADYITRSGQHLLALINDILDISRIESGQVHMRVEEVSLLALFDRAAANVSEQIATKGITLTMDPGDVAAMAADDAKATQILGCLLTNAAKFTPPGGTVRLAARREPGAVAISVTDTGIGIAPDDQERIFGDFTQLDSTVARMHEGLGLGLALARRLVQLHGGTIAVQSTVGEGSTFTVTLPQ